LAQIADAFHSPASGQTPDLNRSSFVNLPTGATGVPIALQPRHLQTMNEGSLIVISPLRSPDQLRK
jgi:hypothetical protein